MFAQLSLYARTQIGATIGLNVVKIARLDIHLQLPFFAYVVVQTQAHPTLHIHWVCFRGLSVNLAHASVQEQRHRPET